MKTEKVIFVLMILVGVVALSLTVGLLVNWESQKDVTLDLSQGKVNYPSSSGGRVFLSNQVSPRNYCAG